MFIAERKSVNHVSRCEIVTTYPCKYEHKPKWESFSKFWTKLLQRKRTYVGPSGIDTIFWLLDLNFLLSEIIIQNAGAFFMLWLLVDMRKMANQESSDNWAKLSLVYLISCFNICLLLISNPFHYNKSNNFNVYGICLWGGGLPIKM